MVVGSILAAGRGTRLGSERPKQYLEVLGKPVLAWTLEQFEASTVIDAIQVVCRAEDESTVRAIARQYGIDKLRWVVPGGESCPLSIASGVKHLRGILSEADVFVLHMGVSPLVTPGDIAQSVELCREKGCCFTMHPVNICMARRGGDGWADTDAPKEQFIELNTPWAFRFGAVSGLYARLEEEGYRLKDADYTLSLWLADGRRAWYARGSDQGRMKITTAHDLTLLEAYLARQTTKARDEACEAVSRP